jgi:uncharacterized membrane protein YraQ (UPF0718 family)
LIIVDILRESWNILWLSAPYLFFGFLLAGLLHVALPKGYVRKVLGRQGKRSVFLSTLVGAPMPICSCGVIPMATSLRKEGASKGAVSSFLVSTPETGVDSIAITWGLMGGPFAILRPIAAVFTAIVAGLAEHFFGNPEAGEKPEEVTTESNETNGNGRPTLREGLRYSFYPVFRMIYKYFFIGLLIGGVITAVLPESLFTGTFGQGWTSLVIMLLAGLPLYICATSSTPVAASMVAMGLSPGAALVFLLAGPATNTTTMGVVLKVLGRRSLAIYVASIAVVSLALGALVNTFFADMFAGIDFREHLHGGFIPGWLHLATSVFIIAWSVWLFWHDRSKRHGKEHHHVEEPQAAAMTKMPT